MEFKQTKMDTLCATLFFLVGSFTILVSRETQAANILFYSGKGEGSHYVAAAGVAEELVAQGHSVTFLLAYKYMHHAHHPVHSKMFSFIPCNYSHEEYEAFSHKFTQIALEGRNIYYESDLIWTVLNLEVRWCENVFHPSMLKTLVDKKFDVVVFDPMWPCAVALSQYLGGKKIALNPSSLFPFLLRAVGNPVNPATTAEIGFGFPQRMDFLQRVYTVLTVGFGHVGISYYFDAPYKHIFAPLGIKPYHSTLKDVDLTIVSADPLVDKSFATMPGVVVAAGLTTASSNHLPEDLEKFMQSSGEHGVILFSLGTYVTHLPEEFVKVFKEAFAKLPQKVLWQWKGETPPANMPDNVKTMTWLPQNDLLGHNKTRLLVFQSGNNGLYEAIYHGVPLLAMPFLIDHQDTAENIAAKGIGRKILAKGLTSEDVFEAISDILSDQKYQRKINHMSAVFRDQPLPPRKKAAFWINHVIKYGSDHLRSPNHDFNFIELNMIDVFAFLIACLVVFLILIYYILKYFIKVSKQILFGIKAKKD